MKGLLNILYALVGEIELKETGQSLSHILLCNVEPELMSYEVAMGLLAQGSVGKSHVDRTRRIMNIGHPRNGRKACRLQGRLLELNGCSSGRQFRLDW